MFQSLNISFEDKRGWYIQLLADLPYADQDYIQDRASRSILQSSALDYCLSLPVDMHII